MRSIRLVANFHVIEVSNLMVVDGKPLKSYLKPRSVPTNTETPQVDS